MERTCISLRITGRVQGVWYRATARKEAERLGIDGFVENRADGSVYAEACGSRDQLDRFVAWCREGPEFAVVDGVEVRPADRDLRGGFRIRR